MNLFLHPWYLVDAFAVLILGGAIAWWAAKRRNQLAAAFADPVLLSRLFDARALKTRTRVTWLRLTALALLFLALASPQWGVELVTSRIQGTHVVIALDTSTSMLAEDLKPNRLMRAKSAMTQLINGLVGSRIGIVAFAGEAFLQCPLTTDTAAAKSILWRLVPGRIRTPGTEMGKAIDLGVEMLSKFEGHKALVLLTDGEDHGKGALAGAKAAAEEGVHIFVIGTGTPEGVPIPKKNSDGKVIGYKKDRSGKTVISRLGEASLIAVARASHGAYFRGTSTEEEIGAIVAQIQALDRTEVSGGTANRFKNRYRAPLLLAFLLLLAAMAWPELPRKKFSAKKTAAPAALALLLLCAVSARAMPGEVDVWRGNRDYRDGNYGKALEHYHTSGPETDKGLFNAGAALFKMDEFKKAAGAYGALIERIDPDPSSVALPDDVPINRKKIAPQAYYNLGNALFKMDRLNEAAGAYKRCLILDPSDEDCRHNLVLSLRPRDKKKQDQKKKDQKKKQEKKDKEKKKKKDEKGKPPPPKDRPREQEFSKEDAERILKAVREKERAAQKRQPLHKNPVKGSPSEHGEDW